MNLIISDGTDFFYFLWNYIQIQAVKIKGITKSSSLLLLNKSWFLPPHTAHFDEDIISSFIGLYNFWVFTFCIFPTLQSIRLILQKFLLNFKDQLTKFYQSYLAGLLLLALWQILIFYYYKPNRLIKALVFLLCCFRDPWVFAFWIFFVLQTKR